MPLIGMYKVLPHFRASGAALDLIERDRARLFCQLRGDALRPVSPWIANSPPEEFWGGGEGARRGKLFKTAVCMLM